MMVSGLYSNDPAERAKALLVHYFRLIAERAGVNWNSDNDAEVASIVDEIVTASKSNA